MPYIRTKGKRGEDMSNLMSDEKLLEVANRKFFDCFDRNLTSSQGIFYLRLVKYATSDGLLTKNKDGYVLLLTNEEMVELFMQKKSFINNALTSFAKAELIERRSLTKFEKEALFGNEDCNKGQGNCKVTKILMSNIVAEKE